MQRRQQSAVCAYMRRCAAPTGWLLLFAPTAARADLLEGFSALADLRNNHDVFIVSALVGLTLFAATVALLHLAGRRGWQQRENAYIAELNELRAKIDRLETFLAAEPQITIAWGLHSSEPEIEGDVSLVSDTPILRRVLGFGSWLSPDQAQLLDTAVAKLRDRGEPFRIALAALNGRHLETQGHPVAGRAVMRIRDVSGDRLDATRLREGLARVNAQLDALRTLLDNVPHPAWTRDDTGRLTWVNNAYAVAVEAKDPQDAVVRNIDLLEAPAREAMTECRAAKKIFRGRAAAVLAEWRRSLEIVEVPLDDRAVGIAFDVSELDALRVELQVLMQGHARTLDQLSTAVAIFDRRKQLVFYNAAYRQLWGLDAAFLDQKPSESEILDRLRVRRMLPEQADFRKWKDTHFGAYQSPETRQQEWHLPDRRTLRVVIDPNPQSGVTYLFDDLTSFVNLERQFIEQTRVQRETLDTLKEGIAVFGTDGRLKLWNVAYGDIWRLDPADLESAPHIDLVAQLSAKLAPDAEPWNAIRTAVAGLHDRRVGRELRITCKDGEIVDCRTAPLPNGATLLTFTNVTDNVNAERALTESNEALRSAEKLRNDFVHHVSYELRSPLTNIIGFIQLLGEGEIGSLNPKQSEYVGYVMKSSAALLAIINDILDLATIDRGALELDLKRIDVMETINGAAEGVQDRLAESSLRLQVVALPNIGTFRADPKRVRQVLFNLLSNAIGFSSPGQTVTLAAMRRGNQIVFKVSDQGRGIPEEVVNRVFERFHSDSIGSRHRGVGLGLSIVKSFVELHNGEVRIDSVIGQGTTVTCIFPAQDETVSPSEEVKETR